MIGPLLGAAASGLAAKGLREAVAEVQRNTALWLATGIAMAMGAVCLTGAAFFALAQRMSPAEALAILGGVYFLAGGVFFLLRRRAS